MNMKRVRTTDATPNHQTYYVMLMPNEDYCVKATNDPVLSAEQLALDCWVIEATSKNHALGKLLHKLYHQLRPSQTTTVRQQLSPEAATT